MAESRAVGWRRLIALLAALALFAAACGGGDDEEADGGDDTSEESTDTAEDTSDDDGMEEGETGDSVEVATGTVLPIAECPDDWSNTQGVTDTEIRIGQSLPQSGQLAGFGPIADGMAAYFDYVNENDPIGGRELVLVARDDAYEAGRTVANVEEMLETEDIFAFSHIVGSPPNLGVRPILDEACVPQLFNSTGLGNWGDPANWPWTLGGLLAYNTEAQLWCENVVSELGEGATVAGLFTNNDFGKAYQSGLEGCDAAGVIDLVANEVHEQGAPDITNEMTNMIASEADVFVFGSTGQFCPQAVGGVAASSWRPLFYMSNTCSNLAQFFDPVSEQAELLAGEGSAVRMVANVKNFTDPTYENDEAIVLGREILAASGLDDAGSQTTGILFAYVLVEALRAAEASGELTRTSVMEAAWNMDITNPYLLDGLTMKTDGTNDAYLVEGARFEQVVTVDGALSFEAISDLVNVEGQTGTWAG